MAIAAFWTSSLETCALRVFVLDITSIRIRSIYVSLTKADISYANVYFNLVLAILKPNLQAQIQQSLEYYTFCLYC